MDNRSCYRCGMVGHISSQCSTPGGDYRGNRGGSRGSRGGYPMSVTGTQLVQGIFQAQVKSRASRVAGGFGAVLPFVSSAYLILQGLAATIVEVAIWPVIAVSLTMADVLVVVVAAVEVVEAAEAEAVVAALVVVAAVAVATLAERMVIYPEIVPQNIDLMTAVVYSATRTFILFLFLTRCNKPGHIARDCPESGQGRQCFKCKSYGHIAVDCTVEG
ncbi:unnamed protein product [Protopolystoma xenopodis]|uniref:CCHC-type domain-containing protein n=1 Tax=Protopolystoma xenopodis TaxID=117903 RepID=A0A3S5A6J6_9PLAT|nr:unnamed protein product [Protopolystoma xenopodis]